MTSPLREPAVAVHAEEDRKVFTPLSSLREVGCEAVSLDGFSVILPAQAQSKQETTPLSNECAKGHTFDLHAADNNQKQAHHHVDHILKDGHHHRRTRVLHADEPPRQAVKAQRSRCSPNANIKIGVEERTNLGRRAHDEIGQHAERTCKQKKCQGDDHSNDFGPYQKAYHSLLNTILPMAMAPI